MRYVLKWRLTLFQERDFWEQLKRYGEQNKDLRDKAFQAFSERGGYPVAHIERNSKWEQIASQLIENVIRRVIRQDLRIGTIGRKRDPDFLLRPAPVQHRHHVGAGPRP